MAELRDAFMAGFMASGEGWNGEWPFGKEDGPTDEQRAKLEAAFVYWAQRLR